jgi:hypothetical protein
MTWWGRCSSKILRITCVAAISCTMLLAAPPVMVELFTSEGCSSCPPADLLLQKLERGQLIPGVTVIGLSEHVDYWNHLGWADPFSSAQMTSRQQEYAARFRSKGAYTPQMVVDGVEEFVGSDVAQARRAIAVAAQRSKLEVTADLVDPGLLHVSVPASSTPAGVFVALVYDPDPSAVARGENSGRHLTHISVVKSLKHVGDVSRNKGFDTRVPVPKNTLTNQQLVVFVQERGQGRILGSAAVSVRQSAGIVARWSPQK